MSLDIYTDSKDTWHEFLDIVANSFQNTIPLVKSHPDEEKRKEFLSAFMKIQYESTLSNGTAGIVCLKSTVDSKDSTVKSEIIYAMCIFYSEYNECFKPRDIATLRDIDTRGWEIYCSRISWEDIEIFQKIDSIKRTLDLTCIYGAYHATAVQYRGKGIAKQHGYQAIKSLYEDGIKRGVVDGSKPAFFYCIVDDVRAKNTALSLNLEVIAHLHFSTKTDLPIMCVDDKEKRKAEDVDCVYVLACVLTGETDLLAEIRRMFLNDINS